MWIFDGKSGHFLSTGTILEVTQTSKVSVVVELYVSKEDLADGIEVVAEYTVAVTDFYDWENTQAVLSAMEKITENSVRIKNYTNAFAMSDAFFAGEVDVMLINSVYVGIQNKGRNCGRRFGVRTICGVYQWL